MSTETRPGQTPLRGPAGATASIPWQPARAGAAGPSGGRGSIPQQRGGGSPVGGSRLGTPAVDSGQRSTLDETTDAAAHQRTGQGPAAVAGPADRAVMRMRLAAMAAPRESDNASLAALRRVLRDERLMAQVTATVEAWPPLTDEQRARWSSCSIDRVRRDQTAPIEPAVTYPTPARSAPATPGPWRLCGDGLQAEGVFRFDLHRGRVEAPTAPPRRQDRYGAQRSTTRR
jgi:hypothetical protein